MFMLKSFRYITGYVKFSGKGTFPERFLNLCANNNILVWSPKVKYGEISGFMHINDYKNIRKIAKKSCMRLKIEKRRGAPFLINRYKKRYGIPIGFALFFFVLVYLSGFCLNITVTGDVVKTEKVENALADSGIYLGRRISDIDSDVARQRFLIKNKDFSYAAINIKGSHIAVELVKTDKKKMKNTSKFPCNVTAKTAGEILKIKAYEGKISVKIGEAVAPGDLLVSGVIELTDKTTKFVHAEAEVIALTRHKLEVFAPFKSKQRLKEGKNISRSVLKIANINIPLFLGEVKKPYETKKSVKKYKIGSCEMPLKIIKVDFTKVKYKKVLLNKNSAKILAKQKMNELKKKKLKNSVKSSQKGKFRVTKKGVFYSKVYFCEENIAKSKKILKWWWQIKKNMLY